MRLRKFNKTDYEKEERFSVADAVAVGFLCIKN